MRGIEFWPDEHWESPLWLWHRKTGGGSDYLLVGDRADWQAQTIQGSKSGPAAERQLLETLGSLTAHVPPTTSEFHEAGGVLWPVWHEGERAVRARGPKGRSSGFGTDGVV